MHSVSIMLNSLSLSLQGVNAFTRLPYATFPEFLVVDIMHSLYLGPVQRLLGRVLDVRSLNRAYKPMHSTPLDGPAAARRRIGDGQGSRLSGLSMVLLPCGHRAVCTLSCISILFLCT